MRLFILFGSLLVLALIAALVVPPYVDWNQFKDRFEQESSKVLGQRVQVRGETNLRLLPLPTLIFNDLVIGTDEAPMLEADSFRMDVELAPLLKGDVVIVDMQLIQPEIEIHADESGKLHWPETSDQVMRDFGLNEISMERVKIIDGKVRFTDARNQREVVLADVNIDATAKTLSGPWRGSGQVSYDGVGYRFSGSTGLWHDPGEMRVRLKVFPQNLPYNFELDGPMKIAELTPSISGNLLVRPIMEPVGEEDSDFLRPARETALPIRLEADLELAAGGATVPAFELTIGGGDDPYKMTGVGQALFKEEVSYQFRVEGQQIDVERLTGQESGKAETAKAKSLNLNQRVDAVLALLEKVPRFNANGEVNLYLPAVITGNTVIREIGVDLRPSAAGTGWQLRNLEAQFPGRTDVRADGVLSLGDQLGYEGELLVASRQPSGLAAWLGVEATAAIREMPSAGFSANARITRTDAAFDDLEIALGKRILKGKIHRKSHADSSPQLFANLSGSGVNLDQVTALVGMFAGADPKSGATVLGAHEIDLELRADTLIASGVTAKSVETALTYKGNALDLKSLKIANLAGANIALSGSLSDITTYPVGELTGKYDAENSNQFLKLLHEQGLNWPILKRLAEDPLLTATTRLEGSLKINPTGYHLKSKGISGGSNVDFELSGNALNQNLEKQKLKGRLIIDNAQAAQLLLQMGVPVVSLNAEGRAAFRVVANGTVEKGLNVEGAFTMREGYVSGVGKVSTRASDGLAQLNANIKLTAEAQNLDPFIMLSGLPVPGLGHGRSVRLTGMLETDGELVRLKDFKSRIGDAIVAGSLALNAYAKPRARVNGQLNMSSLDLMALVGLVYTGQSGTSADAQEGQTTEVAPVLAGLDAEIALKSDSTELPQGVGRATNVSSQLTIRDGDMNFSAIDGEWAGGKLSGEINFARSSGNNLLNGELKLQGADIASLVKTAGFTPIATGKVSGSGTFESTGTGGASVLPKLTGSGTLSLAAGTLNGLDEQAFAKILKAADKTDDKKLEGEVSNILTENAFSGAMSFEPTDVVFNVSSGVVRAANVRLKNKKMTVLGIGRFDLNSGTFTADARVAYDPARQNVAGASPEFSLEFQGKAGNIKRSQDDELFGTYLGLRLSERRQRTFEAQQSEILERQRLQQIAYLYALQENAKRIAAEEEARRIRLQEEEALRIRKTEEENALRIKLEEEETEQSRREGVLKELEEVQRQRLKEELIAAENESKQDIQSEATEQERMDLLRKQAEEALERVRKGLVKPIE